MSDTGRVTSIDVGFTRAEIPSADVAVVIDVLRATSTIVQALHAGYRRVLCCESLAAARSLRGPGRVLAGERNCVPAPGFDLGNSPAAIASHAPLGDELVLATTNGSPAIVGASRRVDRVLIGCLLNLRATVAAIPPDVRLAIVCSGTDGRPALEDAYVAGRIIQQLRGGLSDGARVAVCVAEAYGGPFEPLAASADGVMLESTGQMPDIAWCARESTIDLVPEAITVSDQAAAVSLPSAAALSPRTQGPREYISEIR